MRVHVLEREQVIPAGIDDVWAFFGDAGNLEAITPPFLGFRVVTPQPIPMAVGTFIEYRLRLHGVPLRWLTRIEAWEPPHRFVDVQVRGPYGLWHHTHTFHPHPGGTFIRDRVRYRLPFGPLGVAGLPLVKRDLRLIFDYRHAEISRRFQRGGVGRR